MTRCWVWLVPLGMCARCTFPNVQFSDASMPLVDASDAGSDVDLGDAGEAGETGGEAGDPCDLDNDGFKAEGACNGKDCNDHDPRVNPGVTQFVTDVPDAAPFGDWNCDGVVTLQYPTMSCGIAQCNQGAGFVSAEGCGITGAWETCTGICVVADAGSRTQGCL